MADSEKKTQQARSTRRHMLKVIGTVPAAALIPLAPTQAVAAAAGRRAVGEVQEAAKAYQPRVLNSHEWKTIRLLSDLIIPADDRSGSATQAAVPEFIDDWLGLRRGTLLAEIRGGLTWLDLECNRLFGHDFVDCTASQQTQILDRIAYPGKAALEDGHAVAFFNHLRDLVVTGFFSSEMGVKDLPYLGNTMVAEWKGCPPEVLDKLGIKSE